MKNLKNDTMPDIIYQHNGSCPMAYSIPSDEILEDAIFSVMYRNNQVRSQKEMVELVNIELAKKGDYRASGERIRRVAIDRDLVRLDIRYNEFNDSDLPEYCPVCRNPMQSIYNKTLYDQTIEVKRKCSSCSYSVGKRKRMPGHYTFVRKR